MATTTKRLDRVWGRLAPRILRFRSRTCSSRWRQTGGFDQGAAYHLARICVNHAAKLTVTQSKSNVKLMVGSSN